MSKSNIFYSLIIPHVNRHYAPDVRAVIDALSPSGTGGMFQRTSLSYIYLT